MNSMGTGFVSCSASLQSVQSFPDLAVSTTYTKMLSGKALRMNNTLLYPSLSDETFSLDRKTIKKKVGEILKVVSCVGRLNVTTQYFFCSLDFVLLLFKK